MIRHQEIDGPRPVRPHEYDSTIGLCNRVLRPHGPHTIADEYPLVLTPANAAHMWVVAVGERVVSHAATYTATARIAAGVTLRIGGINSVATEPSFRRRGYASELVQACCEDLRRQGCHFAVLWTEVKGFYERLGFASLGSELLYRLTPVDVRAIPAGPASIRPFRHRDLDALARLRTEAFPHFDRSSAEWRAYATIPKLQVWVACRNDVPTAYLMVGKGEDFRNCAHEWSGGPEDVLALVAHATGDSPRRELILLAPDDAGRVNATLQRVGAPFIHTELGMFRCLDPEGAFEAVRPWIEDRAGCDLALAHRHGRWELRVDDTPLPLLTTEAFCALLLGPRRARDVIAGPEMAMHLLEQALPLPLFIWGLDSV